MARTVRQNRIKKLLALMLALAMTAGLAACSGEDATESGVQTDGPGQQTDSSGESGSGTGAADGPERVLEVGFGKVCVTPTQTQMDAGILLGGGACKGKLDDIYAIALAFRDEEGSIFIHVVVDMNTARIADSGNYTTSLNLGDLGRRAIKERLGISPDRVTIGATHNHSYVKYGVNDEPNRQWRETVLMPGMADAAQAAIDDLAPAEIYTGKTATSKLTFVRRYWLSDGTFYDGYKEKRDSEIVSHESDPDEEIQLVRFVRGEKRDILLVNWQSHATKVTSSSREISADYVGPLRDQVEAELDVNCVFCQGAAGTLAPGSRVAGEAAIPDSGWEAAKKLGKAVAAYVVDACDSGALHRVKAGLLRTERKVVTAQVKKYAEIGDPLYNDALKVTEYAKSAANNYETAAYAAQFGIETDKFLQCWTYMCQAHQIPDTIFSGRILYESGAIDVNRCDTITRRRFLILSIKEVREVGVTMHEPLLMHIHKEMR